MNLTIHIDDELDNWLSRESKDRGLSKEELVEGILMDAYREGV